MPTARAREASRISSAHSCRCSGDQSAAPLHRPVRHRQPGLLRMRIVVTMSSGQMSSSLRARPDLAGISVVKNAQLVAEFRVRRSEPAALRPTSSWWLLVSTRRETVSQPHQPVGRNTLWSGFRQHFLVGAVIGPTQPRTGTAPAQVALELGGQRIAVDLGQRLVDVQPSASPRSSSAATYSAISSSSAVISVTACPPRPARAGRPAAPRCPDVLDPPQQRHGGLGVGRLGHVVRDRGPERDGGNARGHAGVLEHPGDPGRPS